MCSSAPADGALAAIKAISARSRHCAARRRQHAYNQSPMNILNGHRGRGARLCRHDRARQSPQKASAPTRNHPRPSEIVPPASFIAAVRAAVLAGGCA
eukprot:5919251-Prymnesium_polylepis.2